MRILLKPYQLLFLFTVLTFACTEDNESVDTTQNHTQTPYLPEGVVSIDYVSRQHPYVQAFEAQYKQKINAQLAQNNIQLVRFEQRLDQPVLFIPVTTNQKHIEQELEVIVIDAENQVFEASINKWEFKTRGEDIFQAVYTKLDLEGNMLYRKNVNQNLKQIQSNRQADLDINCIPITGGLDTNNDGMVSLIEWRAGFGTEEGFQAADANGDGFLDQSELATVDNNCIGLCTDCLINNCFADRICRLAYWEDPKGLFKLFEFSCKDGCKDR